MGSLLLRIRPVAGLASILFVGDELLSRREEASENLLGILVHLAEAWVLDRNGLSNDRPILRTRTVAHFCCSAPK